MNEFADALVTDTDEYEVAISIKDIDLPEAPLVLGRTAFVNFVGSVHKEWGLDARSALKPGPVGLVRVQAGSFDRAWELAAEDVDTSLNLLRAAGRTHRGTPTDEPFLQRRGTRYAVKKLAEPPQIVSGIRRGFSPLRLNLREPPFNALEFPIRRFAEWSKPLFDGTLPAGLAEPLVRALEWIGSSVARERHDDKVVDLCTALETVLTLESDQLKGETVALRYCVLTYLTTKSFTNLRAILPLYRVRSRLVHGAARRLAGGYDYQALLEVAIEAVRLAMVLASSDRTILTVKHLIAKLDADAHAIEQVLLIIFEPEKYRDDRAVVKVGREVLAGLQASS